MTSKLLLPTKPSDNRPVRHHHCDSHWKFDVITEWDKVFDGKNTRKWQHHVENAEETNVFLHPVLARIWVDTYLPLRNLKPVFIWAHSGNGNTGLMPMVLWKRNWKNAFKKMLIPIGYSDFDYHDPIFTEKPSDAEYDRFWEELLNRLNEFGADETSIDGVVRTSRNAEWEETEICPFLDLGSLNTEEDLLKFLKTSLRGDIRRQIRRLNGIGTLSLRHYHSWEEASATFERFMTQHSLRWPNAYKAPGFHKRLLQDGLSSGSVDFSSLNVGDRPIAWHLGFHHNGHYYYYMPCGDHKFSQYSPVKVHLFKLISNSIQQGDILFDHLRGDETYKGGWSNGSRHVHHFTRTSCRPLSILKCKLSDGAHRLSR